MNFFTAWIYNTSWWATTLLVLAAIVASVIIERLLSYAQLFAARLRYAREKRLQATFNPAWMDYEAWQENVGGMNL